MFGVTLAAAVTALVLIPAARRVAFGPIVRLGASATLDVRAGTRLCSEYLRDVRNLGDYEQKVTRCTVDDQRREGCTFSCRGWYFGIPWRGTFDLRHTRDGGFESVARGGLVRGGFVCAPQDGEVVRITHWESYALPWWTPFLWAVRPAVQRWLTRSVEVEMAVVAESLEYLQRAGHREPILPSHRSAAYRASRYSLGAFVREQVGAPPTG